jgi:hypothetical protein
MYFSGTLSPRSPLARRPGQLSNGRPVSWGLSALREVAKTRLRSPTPDPSDHPGSPRDGNQAKAKDAAQWLTDGHRGEGQNVGGGC